MKILAICSSRANYIKVSSLSREVCRRKGILLDVFDTRSEYEYLLEQRIFQDEDLVKPNFFLYAKSFGEIFSNFENDLDSINPDLVMVFGDNDSALACSICAKKKGVKVAHVDAGLRSFDMRMPEEVNRSMIDNASDFLFVSEHVGEENLKNLGVEFEKVFMVGNIAVDAIKENIDKYKEETLQNKLAEYNFRYNNVDREDTDNYCVVYLNRYRNLNKPNRLKEIMKAVDNIESDFHVLIPANEELHSRLKDINWEPKGKIKYVPPISFEGMCVLVSKAKFVITDSGMTQIMCTYLKTHCLTVRASTEHECTKNCGNKLVHPICGNILHYVGDTVKGNKIISNVKHPNMWDGKTSSRILDILMALERNNWTGHFMCENEYGKSEINRTRPYPIMGGEEFMTNLKEVYKREIEDKRKKCEEKSEEIFEKANEDKASFLNMERLGLKSKEELTEIIEDCNDEVSKYIYPKIKYVEDVEEDDPSKCEFDGIEITPDSDPEEVVEEARKILGKTNKQIILDDLSYVNEEEIQKNEKNCNNIGSTSELHEDCSPNSETKRE